MTHFDQLGQWSPGITRWARALFQAAGLYDPEPRHTFASDLAGRGTDLETLRDRLGHPSVQTTEISHGDGAEAGGGGVARIGAWEARALPHRL